MAQFKLKSADIMLSLGALLKRMAEAIQYVLAHPGEITIRVPDQEPQEILYAHSGCPPDKTAPPPEVTDRQNAEILLAVLKLVNDGGRKKSGR